MNGRCASRRSAALRAEPVALSQAKPAAAIANGFFPFTLYANETAHFTSSPHGFRAAFVANKPHGLSWYAYDVTLLSPTAVGFTVYDMRDNWSGGIGAKKDYFEATVSADITRDAIEREIRRCAIERRAEELAVAEDAIVTAYSSELRAALAAGSGTAETNEDLAQCEASQSGDAKAAQRPKGVQ